MERASLEQYQGKKIRLILTDGFTFSGKIESLNDTEFTLRDKFQELVTISYDNVSIVREVPK